MQVTSSHTKNPLMGWDISASAKVDKGERISHAKIVVNDFPEYDQEFDPPISAWQENLIQQGQSRKQYCASDRDQRQTGRHRIGRFLELITANRRREP